MWLTTYDEYFDERRIRIIIYGRLKKCFSSSKNFTKIVQTVLKQRKFSATVQSFIVNWRISSHHTTKWLLHQLQHYQKLQNFLPWRWHPKWHQWNYGALLADRWLQRIGFGTVDEAISASNDDNVLAHKTIYYNTHLGPGRQLERVKFSNGNRVWHLSEK